MPLVTCSEPNCGLTISDPCVQTHVLFLTKLRVTANMAKSGVKSRYIEELNMVNNELKSEKFELLDHEQQFQTFVNERFDPASPTQSQTIRVFILQCSKGHRNQYSLTCT